MTCGSLWLPAWLKWCRAPGWEHSPSLTLYHSVPYGATNGLFTTINWSQDSLQQLHVSMCHHIRLSVCFSALCLEHICSNVRAVDVMVHKCARCSHYQELCHSCPISLTRDRIIKQRRGLGTLLAFIQAAFPIRSNFMSMNTTVHTLRLTVTLSLPLNYPFRPKDKAKADSQGKTLRESINH